MGERLYREGGVLRRDAVALLIVVGPAPGVVRPLMQDLVELQRVDPLDIDDRD